MQRNIWTIGFLLALVMFMSQGAVQAGEIYIGGGATFNEINNVGEFDGQHILAGEDLWDIPKPGANSTGFLLRCGGSDRYFGLDLQYARQIHAFEKSSLYDPPRSSDLFYTFFDINLKLIAPIGLLDLYGIGGLGVAILEVEKGLLTAQGYSDLATYSGVAWNLGVGADYYFAPAFSVFAEYCYRFLSYSSVNEFEIDEAIQGGGMHSLQVGVKYHFQVGF